LLALPHSWFKRRFFDRRRYAPTATRSCLFPSDNVLVVNMSSPSVSFVFVLQLDSAANSATAFDVTFEMEVVACLGSVMDLACAISESPYHVQVRAQHISARADRDIGDNFQLTPSASEMPAVVSIAASTQAAAT
jgi:hypothetical protein